ncbi:MULTISPECIES: DUF445 domain-containing protein [unclassified Clostridium]|uniref:DUF445 domain-containing protein n=1 Tax=unclassified Clostridium TaxID=2614128 RepID=UPI000297373E|nr:MULTISPECIES: DUF445 domain-containing protein [unclassified Clostridium]EKQ57393.1 MAG: putative membrane protein [Clostridium sp. Maddingley MBC34-26]
MKIKTNQKASISLMIMFIGFLFTLFSNNLITIMILQSGFEAGVVGGIADWFAVSALFRYPLGIKVPHTALLPKNRQRITTALVSIVENNLLNKSSILNKVNELSIVTRFLNLFKNSVYSNEIKSKIVFIIRSGIDYISIPKVSAYLLSLIEGYLNKLDSKNLLEALTSMCLENNYEQKIMNNLLDACESLVKREDIKNEFGNIIFTSTKNLKINVIKQYTLNTIVNIIGKEKIGAIVQDLIFLVLKDLRNLDNSSRIMILKFMQDSIKSVSENEDIVKKIDQYKSSLVNNAELNHYLMRTLSEAKTTILIYINDNDFIEGTILPFLNNLIDKILANTELIDKLEHYIKEQVSEYINNNHEKIGKLVKENIEKIDTDTLIELIEYRIGDDLQWIRVNGAICGFIIGLILGIIRVFMGRV